MQMINVKVPNICPHKNRIIQLRISLEEEINLQVEKKPGKTYKIISFLLPIFFLFLLNGFIPKKLNAWVGDTAIYTVNVYPEKDAGKVSPLIMGFNTVYSYEPDAMWKNGNGKIPQLLQQLKTGILRYPGGTVTTNYHWEHPTGQGWSDSWNPGFDVSKNQSPDSFMDIDEYLAVCRKLKTEPLIGINLGSGKKYNRVNEGIEEAKRLVAHCKNSGVKVKYFYLDNEPYHSTANYTFTADEYAEMINAYVPEMKKIDAGIQIIVNTHPRDLDYTRPLIAKAGKNIDFIDIHFYWRWGNATYANWKAQKAMRQGDGLPYDQQRAFYRKLVDSMGFPHIDLISLEWNVGKIGKGNKPPSQAEVALMVSEQFTQFIQSGMPIATFWPVSWPKPSDFDNRVLLNAQQDYKPNKVYDMFKLYSEILGHEKIENSTSSEAIRVLSVKNEKRDTIWIYIINKDKDRAFSLINLNMKDFVATKFKVIGFSAEDKSEGPLKIEPLEMESNSSGTFKLKMAQYSLAKITLIRKD